MWPIVSVKHKAICRAHPVSVLYSLYCAYVETVGMRLISIAQYCSIPWTTLYSVVM